MSPALALGTSVALALALSGGARTDHFEPQKRLEPADQARAKSMLVRRSDVGPRYKPMAPVTPNDENLACRALDLSDLTLTVRCERCIA
jgi:hypothetical protein